MSIYSILDDGKKLENRRAIRREKNELHNKINELEDKIIDSLIEGNERLTDEARRKIEDSIEVMENRIGYLEKVLKDKSYK
ncbi:hypothetical protein [Clostridium neonatale]|uniref:Uncharacterized protein n=1 Tax=Clostridium neonatale TaxID=137838 RepID=A0AAD2DFY6_9CLOT|nr:hypothetical protein [Clostridium neonatale]MBP8312816.1 hypothetical protein [Clostridium neonatale]CAI3195222.1 hypothetical protein CNEO2_1300003 [Clostridium neonatale]CAI3214090.1 hypothetical protein CNEO2_960022 [Clostridium neonatale]CAI3216159.1 hypothetical protein CNEO2_960003 [Clostridium neonatale]CAI3216674.1 hypothetical protein CNEO2_1030003 [Clostridium neonatale]